MLQIIKSLLSLLDIFFPETIIKVVKQISKLTIINTLRAMKVQSHRDHVTLKEQQLKKSLELFDNTLKQYC